MGYRIEFAGSTERKFKGLPREVQIRLAPRIDSLADVPRPKGAEKLSGGPDLHRIRVGDYRIIYQIRDDVLIVLVVSIGHRREVYRRLK